MEKTVSKTNGRTLELRMLGAWRMEIGGRIVEMRRKPQMLVKLLALQPKFRLHRDQIVEFLWAEQDADAATNNLHKTVHAVRRAFEPNLKTGGDSRFLLTRDGQIILTAPNEICVDVLEFERLAPFALKSDDENLCENALAIYTGDLLPEDIYEDWANGRRESLRVLRHSLLEKTGAIYQGKEEYERGAAIFQKLIQTDELDEAAHRSLMRNFALQGNRGRALRQFEICRTVLKNQLGIEPERETRELFEQIQAEKIQAKIERIISPVKSSPKTNLTDRLTSFIGREREIAEIKNLFASHRLITLTGTGGIGKTRLAQKIASEIIENYPHGTWLVEFAALNDASLAAGAIAAAVGVQEKSDETTAETLREFLLERQILLVFDNCEHLIMECAALAAELLQNCPSLRILATSREALDAEGEIVWRVTGLSLPEKFSGASSPQNLNDFDAVKLFVERARLNSPSFAVSESNAAAIEEICRNLGGIPLALELAAARARVISVEQISAHLEDSLRFLIGGGRGKPPRHQTLRAAIDWSYELLTDEEKARWRALSVFAGSFTLEAAEFVCRNLAVEKSSTLDLLTALTDKSIVSVGDAQTVFSYTMLETLRQFGAEKRLEHSEDEKIRHAHFEYFLALAEQTETEFSKSDGRTAFERLESEIDNLRLALEYGAAKNPAAFLRFCNALWQFWQSSGRLEEGRRQFEKAIALNDPMPAESSVKTLHRLGGLKVLQCDYASAARIYEDGLRLAKAAGDKFYEARILANYGFTLVNLNEFARAEITFDKGLKIFRRLKDEKGVAQILNGLGTLAFYRDDLVMALAFYAESMEIYRRIDYRLNIIGTLQNLGVTHHLSGNLREAEICLREVLQIADELNERRWINQTRHVLGYVCNDQKNYKEAMKFFSEALTLDAEIGGKDNAAHTFEGLACTAAALENYPRALRLIAYADRLRTEIETPRSRALQNYFDDYWNVARQSIAPEDSNCVVSEASRMTFDEAVKFALQT